MAFEGNQSHIARKPAKTFHPLNTFNQAYDGNLILSLHFLVSFLIKAGE